MLRRIAAIAVVACATAVPLAVATPASAVCVNLGVAGVCAPPGDPVNCWVLSTYCF